MKNFIGSLLLLVALASNIPAAFAIDKELAQSTVFQVATISSLAQGVYDGKYSYGNLRQHGDFGLGTFLDLNGEMVAVDGHFYQIEADGKLKSVSATQIVPFAEVTFFKPAIHKTLAHISNYAELEKKLLTLFANKNIPYAIRIDGMFSSLKLRNVRKQHKPYPPLAQAAKGQAIFNLQNSKGSLVGYWFPAYWSGIAVAGFHLHYVTSDRSTGGHVLELNLINGKVHVELLQQVQVYLPNTASFAHADLSAEALHSAIKKAEGGSK